MTGGYGLIRFPTSDISSRLPQLHAPASATA